MDKTFILNNYTQFLKTWEGYNTPSLLITSGHLDLNKPNKSKKIVLYQVIPKIINTLFYSSLTTNLYNSSIDEIKLIFPRNRPTDVIPNTQKLSYIEIQKEGNILYNDIVKILDPESINIIIYDNIIFDYQTTQFLKCLDKKQVGLLSSKHFIDNSDRDFSKTFFDKNTCCEFNGFVLNGNPDIITDFYIDMYGSKNLFIQKLFKYSFELVNLSKITNTFLVESNPDYSLTENYVNTPNFPIIFCIDQYNIFLNEKVVLNENLIIDNLSQEKLSESKNIIFSAVQKNIQDFIPVLTYLDLIDLERIFKYNIINECQDKLQVKLQSIIELKETELQRVIQEKETELQRVIQEKETELQEVIQEKETEIREVIQKKETELQEVIQEKETELQQVIQEKETELQQKQNEIQKMIELKDIEYNLKLQQKQSEMDCHFAELQRSFIKRQNSLEEKNLELDNIVKKKNIEFEIQRKTLKERLDIENLEYQTEFNNMKNKLIKEFNQESVKLEEARINYHNAELKRAKSERQKIYNDQLQSYKELLQEGKRR